MRVADSQVVGLDWSARVCDDHAVIFCDGSCCGW